MRTFTRATENLMRHFLIATLFATLIVSSETKAHATAYGWTNAAGGNWTTNGNWDNAGDPNGTGDTASLGDLAGAYTVTLDASRAIGGLSLTGSDPTLQLDNPLVISGGTSTIGGTALLTGSSTMQWSNSAALTWSSTTAPTGTLTFYVPNETAANSVSITNTGGSFAVGTGQTLLMSGPPKTSQSTLTFSDGFSNDGLIQLGNTPPGDNYGKHKLVVTSGTLTNNASGEIRLYPRSATNNSFSDRYIEGDVTNNGTITSFTTDGRLGNTGDTIINNNVMNVDSSVISGGSGTGTPRLRIWGTSFANNGTVNINDGRLEVGTDTFTYVPADYNTTGGILALGRNNNSTVVTWNAADTTDTMTYEITPGADVTINRASAWTLPSNQELKFAIQPTTPNQILTLNQDFNNDGTVTMGRGTGDAYATQLFDITGVGTFTNNSGGTVTMYPRSPTNLSFSRRAIRANVVNDGLITSFTHDGELGTTGKTVVNNGTLTMDSSILTTTEPRLTIFGSSFSNSASGIINIDDGHFVVGTDTYTYDLGTYNINGGIFGLGRLSGSTVVTWNGPDFTEDMEFQITPGAQVTINRTTPWNVLSNQTLNFAIRPTTATHRLTLDQDLNNSGTLTMGRGTGDAYATQYLDFTSGTFNNQASGVVNMYPRSATNLTLGIRAIRGDIDNAGQINVFTNDGQLGNAAKTVSNSGTISLDDAILSAGSGIVELTVTGDSFTNTATGRIQGNGDLVVTGVTGGLMNNGTLAPGLSAGTLDILGNVTNSATSNLEIELGGLIAGTEHDQLNITQTFAIDGDLVITLIDGFESTVTSLDTFTIATFGSVTGTFSNMDDEDRVTIQDFDIDGRFYSFLVTINATNVTLSDFEINPVPEPSSLALIGLGMFGMIGHARRKRRRA